MGCITRTRKAQAPSTLRKTTPPPCPTETGAAGCPASAHARARARTRPTHKERVHARARTRPALKTRAHARTPRAPRRPHRASRHRTARDVRRTPARGRAPRRRAVEEEEGWKGDSNRPWSENNSKRRGNNEHLLDCGGENHPRPTRTSRASASRGRHRRRDRAGESRTARGGRKEKTQHEGDDRRWKEREHTSPRDADVANASPGRPPSRCA